MLIDIYVYFAYHDFLFQYNSFYIQDQKTPEGQQFGSGNREVKNPDVIHLPIHVERKANLLTFIISFYSLTLRNDACY